MGKAVAAGVVFVILLLVAGAIIEVAAKALYRYLWNRALRNAQWEPYVEMTGTKEASITVRRVARLGHRKEILQQFQPEIIHITGLGDPALAEAEGKAQQQAYINNSVGLGKDL